MSVDRRIDVDLDANAAVATVRTEIEALVGDRDPEVETMADKAREADVEEPGGSASSLQLPPSILKDSPPPARLEDGTYGAEALASAAELPGLALARQRCDLPPPGERPHDPDQRVQSHPEARTDRRRRALAGRRLRGDPNDVSSHPLRDSVANRVIVERGQRHEDVQLRPRHANRSTTDRIDSHLVPR